MRKRAFQALIVSVVASAIMGIYALLAGDFGETELKIILTTLSVAGASILGMASGAAMEKQRGGYFPHVGIGASLLGFALVTIGIWAESESEDYWKITGTLVIIGTFAAHAALLRIACLSRRFAWIPVATIVCGAVLAQTIMSLMWGVDMDGDVAARVIGVLSILVAAGTILVPVFARLSRDEFQAVSEDADAPPVCPHCGGRLSAEFVARLVDFQRD